MEATAADTPTWFSLPRVERRWAVSPIPLLIVGVWAAFTAGVHMVGRATGEPIVLCTLKRTTGVPCPGCRGTRAAFALGQGDVLAAVTFNPLATAVLLGLVGWAVLRFGFGRQVRIRWTPGARTAASIAATTAIACNWAYVIYAGG